MDLLLPALALLALWRCRAVRPLSALYEDALSREACLPLRGLMALAVLLHHIAQQTAAGRFFRLFLYVGVLPVSVFFFLSGYGLMRGCLTGRYEQKRFLLRRLTPLLALTLLALCLYALCAAAAGDPLGPSALLGRFLAADPILIILWYVPVIALFYLAFALFLRLFALRPGRLLLAMALFCLGWQLLLGLRGAGQWWINSCHLLVFGMAWALFEQRLRPLVRRAWLPLFLACALGFLLLWKYFDPLFALRPSYGTRLLILLVRGVLFTAGCFLLLGKLRLGNPALRFLGERALALYVLQILPLYLFRSALLWIGDDLLYALAVIAADVLAALLLYPPRRARRRRLAFDKPPSEKA